MHLLKEKGNRMTNQAAGLFQRWLEIERATGRPMSDILDDLNDACGTKYKHNWPSVMASRGFTLERMPTNVRQYMMAKVLPAELERIGAQVNAEQVELLVNLLT